MKLKVYINEEVEERIEIYSHSKSELIDKICELVNETSSKIFGYNNNEIFTLSLNDIYRIYIENNKLYASTTNQRFLLKYRLYQIEELVNEDFIKINQSCLVNKNKIKKFESSWAGSLLVELTNGEKDYISRRQMKNVMKKVGLKNE